MVCVSAGISEINHTSFAGIDVARTALRSWRGEVVVGRSHENMVSFIIIVPSIRFNHSPVTGGRSPAFLSTCPLPGGPWRSSCHWSRSAITLS